LRTIGTPAGNSPATTILSSFVLFMARKSRIKGLSAMLVRMMESRKLSRRRLFGIFALFTARAAVRGADLLPILRLERPRPVPATYLRRYRVHATITVLSVPLFVKENVGGACAMAEQSASGASSVSSIQFASGSWPERLKGFNRFGMAQEAVREEGGKVVESAYLSMMTSSSEKNFEQAKQSFTQQANSQQISVAHGRARASGYASVIDHLALPGQSTWADCPRLMVELGDRLSPLSEYVSSPNRVSAYLPFLHTVRQAMRSAAPSAESVFTHNAKLYRLRTRISAAPGGLLLVGKIAECGNSQESEFRIWFDPQDASGLPLRFEFRPKSFLHLVFERDDAVTAPRFASLIAQEQA
jgi:hypothetical protein